MVFLSLLLNKLPRLNVRDLWETYIIHVFSLFSLQQETYTSRQQLLWIDMPWYLRCCHVIKQIPCYFLLFLFPFFSTCCPWSNVSASLLIFFGLFGVKLIISSWSKSKFSIGEKIKVLIIWGHTNLKTNILICFEVIFFN